VVDKFFVVDDGDGPDHLAGASAVEDEGDTLEEEGVPGDSGSRGIHPLDTGYVIGGLGGL
jgi:hypothetical protein